MKRTSLAACAAATMTMTMGLGVRPAAAEIILADDKDKGWQVSTDGRVNTFVSVARGQGLPDNQPDFPGAGTPDTKDAEDNLRAARIRNGFIMSVLAFNVRKEVSRNFKTSARVGLWMNLAGSRTKNAAALVDPRELYAKIEGGWGSLLLGSDLALFGRGGILVDARIAHNFGLGYPCLVRDASGGSCGMVAFGAPFPGFEPGIIYTSPSVAGLQLSIGAYDPATIANGDLNRAPYPRVEAELKYDFKELFRVFASGFWQVLEGTINDPNSPPGMTLQNDLKTTARGAQVGAMLAVGPVMLGGAAYQGEGFSPITYIDEHQTAVDASGTLRKSSGAFGLAALLLRSMDLKIAGGYGVLRMNKTVNDLSPVSPMGMAQNPQLLRQNTGITVGIYQGVGPLHFALEYFRADHLWYDRGDARPDDPNIIDITRPRQVVNFINAGMTLSW